MVIIDMKNKQHTSTSHSTGLAGNIMLGYQTIVVQAISFPVIIISVVAAK